MRDFQSSYGRLFIIFHSMVANYNWVFLEEWSRYIHFQQRIVKEFSEIISIVSLCLWVWIRFIVPLIAKIIGAKTIYFLSLDGLGTSILHSWIFNIYNPTEAFTSCGEARKIFRCETFIFGNLLISFAVSQVNILHILCCYRSSGLCTNTKFYVFNYKWFRRNGRVREKG